MTRKALMVLVSCAFLTAGIGSVSAEIEFSVTDGQYNLTAADAPVQEVLQTISDETGIPIGIDSSDDSLVNVDLEKVNFEKLINSISSGYAIVYIEDPDTGEYKVERVTTAGQNDAATMDLDSDELPADQVVKAIMERAKAIKQFETEMKMSTTMMGTQMTMDGKMWVDGERARIEMTMQPMGMHQVIVSDGENTYTYMPEMNMVQVMDMKRLEQELGEDFTAASGNQQHSNPFEGVDESSMQYIGRSTYGGEPVYMLEGRLPAAPGTPEGMASFAPQSAQYWVSSKDGMPRKTVFYGSEGQEMFSQEYQAVQINGDIDPAQFEFQVPEGAQVMDMTDMVINMYRGGSMPGMPMQ